MIIGTRGSLLALKQSSLVLEKLQGFYPHIEFSLKKITTRGDRLVDLPLPSFGGKGIFIKELEQALLRGDIDLAVHSFKDLPLEMEPGLEIAAALEREDPRDVLVSRDGLKLHEMPSGSRLGTGSPRRRAQILSFRSDLQVLDMRGNVDTRLRKIEEGFYDGAIMAAAGLLRLGRQNIIAEYLPPEICTPAVGQGAMAIEIKTEKEKIKNIIKVLGNEPARKCLEAERAFLSRLGGGCLTPVAALGTIDGPRLLIRGMVASPDGKVIFRNRIEGPQQEASDLGRILAESLIKEGAGELLKG